MVERKRSPDCVIIRYSPYGFTDRNKTSNGVNDLVQETTPYLEAKGYKIILVGPRIPRNEDNVADYTLGRAKNIPPLLARMYGTSYPFSLPYDKRLATKLISKIQPDVVDMEELFQGFGAHGIISGVPKRDGKPIPVMTARFHTPLENWNWLPEIVLHMGKTVKRPRFNRSGIPSGKFTQGPVNTIINSIDGARAVSEVTKKGVKKHYKIDCEVIPNAINTHEFTPDGPIMEKWKRDDKKIILMPGRNEPRKGKKNGILAYAKLRKQREDVKLIIPGRGIDTNMLKDMVETMSIPDVEFLDTLLLKEYKMGLRTADEVWCPATGEEGFGRVPIEAAASGAIVVASSIPAYREAMEGMPFVLMPEPSNVDDMVKKAAFGLDIQEDARKVWGRLNAEHIHRRFSLEVVTDQEAKFYNECYNGHGGVDWSKLPSSGTLYQRGS